MRAPISLILVALFGCREGKETKPVIADHHTAPPVTAPVPPTATPDPWAAGPADSADDPPSLAERHKRAEEACPLVKAPYFYSIEKAGKVSHILGTRHISVPLAKFPKEVTDAISTAKLAVFEVAPDDNSGVETPKISIKNELGPDLWKKYEALVGKAAAESLEEATPAEAMIWLIAMYEDIGAMLDSEIQRQVQAAKIPTMGLETSAFQDTLLQKLLDIRMLKAEVAHTDGRDELAKESKEDLSEYCAGSDDKPGMDDDTRKDLLEAGYTAAEIDSIDDQMVYQRNASWIPKLEKLFAKGDVFVAVGADHLTGDRGVVALLAKRGFTVKRVPRK
ncbi:MAG TPA: TraB/GumN family protein [Kofleriaceae bacterium]|nr:TraB/GumN family protein [Kofleriaceae bacterium]